MRQERGLSGMLYAREGSYLFDEWILRRDASSVMLYCNCAEFTTALGLPTDGFASVIGKSFTVRLDGDTHILYGPARCSAVSRPSLARQYPLMEYFPRDLAIYLDFEREMYNECHMEQAKALARNGNPLFVDLLPLAEVASKIASGDVRFSR